MNFEDRTELRRVEDLRDGDLVDLESCSYMHEHPSAPYEYAVVDGVERETPECVRVQYLDIDHVGYPVGTQLRVRCA